MYLIEHFSRLDVRGREDTVSLYLASLEAEDVAPEIREAAESFMRMAAVFAKMAVQQRSGALFEHGCRALNRAMQGLERDGTF